MEECSKYHYKQAIIGPPAKRHLNGVSLACRWWPNRDWMMAWQLCDFQGTQTSIAKKTYISIFLWFFRGGGWSDPLSPLDPHMCAKPGRVAQSVTCLATDACLTADPGVASSIPARSHTFVEIDHEIISTVILLPSADSFKKGCCQLQAKVCAQITG